MEDAARVITLELRLDGPAPIGRASTPDNRQRAFAGWLALIAAIEALAAGDAQTAPGHDTQSASNEENLHDGTIR